MMMKLEINELKLFSRQLAILGLEKHNKLKSSKVLVIGCGGLGNTCVPYLYYSGISIGVSDDDLVEESNIHRQYIHSENIGLSKSASMKQKMPNINIEPHFTKESQSMVEKYDIIVDCVDNPYSKYLINTSCVLYNKIWVSSSAVALQGHIATYTPESACYRCINASLPPIASSCDDMGVIGPVPGVFGCLQAIEVINLLVGHSTLQGQMITIRFDRWEIRKIKMRNKQPDCGACGSKKVELVFPNCRKSTQGLSLKEYLCLKDTSLVVDVRPAEKYSIYSVSNSINIPIKHILFHPQKSYDLILESIGDRKQIIFICRRGNDSFTAFTSFNFSIPSYNFAGGYIQLCEEAQYI
eukprot:NODE_1_length_95616_cov_0.657642.p25 type:complete len:354 gc:universal NODE_1_length_95616_cov_0.657642:50452-51513(+)